MASDDQSVRNYSRDGGCPACGCAYGAEHQPGCPREAWVREQRAYFAASERAEPPRNDPAADAAKAAGEAAVFVSAAGSFDVTLRKLSPRPGDLVVVRHPSLLREAARHHLAESLSGLAKEMGCRFVLVPDHVGVEFEVRPGAVGADPSEDGPPSSGAVAAPPDPFQDMTYKYVELSLEEVDALTGRRGAVQGQTVTLLHGGRAVVDDIWNRNDGSVRVVLRRLPDADPLDEACAEVEREVEVRAWSGPPGDPDSRQVGDPVRTTIRPAGDAPAPPRCTCDILTGGCICGVMEAERRAKGE